MNKLISRRQDQNQILFIKRRITFTYYGRILLQHRSKLMSLGRKCQTKAKAGVAKAKFYSFSLIFVCIIPTDLALNIFNGKLGPFRPSVYFDWIFSSRFGIQNGQTFLRTISYIMHYIFEFVLKQL